MTDSNSQEKTELWVIEVCQELGLRVEAADGDFFEAGGNSLTAMKLIAKAEDRFGEDALPPDDLFAQSTVREIAASILRNSTVAS